MTITPDILNSLLRELADLLSLEDCNPVEWVVCGGTALALQQLQSRTTQDIDVLANWNAADLTVMCIKDFPADVKQCIQRVKNNHPELAGLKSKWINLGPAPIAAKGLPNGFEKRLIKMEFSDRLTLHLLGRIDLLALKLYAAADDMGPRRDIHFQDLKGLKPTFDELDSAVDWIRTLSDFETIHMGLKDTVRELGYDDLTYYI